MKSKQDLRWIKTKKSLEQALMTMLKRKDLHEVKIKDLTDKAMISRQTFYRHYEMIEELFQDCVEDLFAEIEAERTKHSEVGNMGSLEEALLDTFQMFNRHREQLTIIFSVSDKNLIIDNLHKQYESAYKRGGFLEYTPPEDTSFQYMYIRYESAGLYILLHEWFTKQRHLTPEEITKIYLDIRTRSFYNQTI